MTEISCTVPDDFRLAGLIEEFNGHWRAYLQERAVPGQLMGLVGRTPQEAIDMTATALRARLRPQATATATARPRPAIKLDLSILKRRLSQ